MNGSANRVTDLPQQTILDSPLLVNFMQTFVGYGNASAAYWPLSTEPSGVVASR